MTLNEAVSLKLPLFNFKDEHLNQVAQTLYNNEYIDISGITWEKSPEYRNLKGQQPAANCYGVILPTDKVSLRFKDAEAFMAQHNLAGNLNSLYKQMYSGSLVQSLIPANNQLIGLNQQVSGMSGGIQQGASGISSGNLANAQARGYQGYQPYLSPSWVFVDGVYSRKDK